MSETRLEILQDLKKEQEQHIRNIDYTLENINYDPDDEDNTNYRRYCEIEDIKEGHKQIAQALDETIYFLQNIEELDDKIQFLETEQTRLNQHITTLAHYWREKDDKAFKERLQVIEQEYRAKGKEDLANYISVQYSDCCAWIPM